MSTGAVSSLIYNFPYHNHSPVLKIIALAVFLLNLVLFVVVCTCTVLRYVLFPEVRFCYKLLTSILSSESAQQSD